MREKLIHAAIERFGTRGFEAVGTREIAAAVDTPMSSITYHFGSKEGLYNAAAEHIFDTMQGFITPLVKEMPGADASKQDHVNSICAALRAVAQFMLSDTSAPFALFVNREQQSPTPAVREMMDCKVMPMLRRLAQQVHLVRPDLDSDAAKALAIYLFGMAVSLRSGLTSITLLFECDELDERTRAILLQQMDQMHRSLLQERTAQ